MAEKGFGVKEVNLIGASGTPTITSPNNINLNAANVAISTNVSVGGTMTVTGGAAFGIGSTVGIGSTLYVSHGDLYLRDNHELNINNDALTMRGNNGGNSFITNLIDISGGAPGNLYISNVTGDVEIDASEHFSVKTNTNEQAILATQNGSVALYHDGGNKKLETNSSGVTVTGTLSATTFSGSGASLTTLPAANLTGTLPAISGANLTGITITPTNSDIQVVYTVTANGSSAYRFAGNGVVSTADDPDLYLIRGQKYRFINNSGGSHPFQIREASGGTAYSTGVTNNGAASGNIDFAPTFDSPAQLVYQCTSHSGMVGNIYLRDAAGNNTNVGVTTFANITANNINGNVDINVGTGEADIYSTGSGDQLSLRLLNSDASAGNKIGIYFGPANNVAGAFIKGHAESDFTSAANRDAGLIFGTRLNGNFLEAMKISSQGYVTKPSYHPAFRAGRSSDVNPGASGTIVFNYVSSPTHFNQGGHYSNSTGAFTAPIAGIYNFYTQVLWENVSSGQDMADAIMLYYNASGGASGGTLVSYDARRAEYIQNETGNAGYYGAFTTLLFYMAANSSIYVRNNYNLTVHGNANFTFFQGYLVG